MKLSQKRKILSDLFFPFSEFWFTFQHFQRNMTVIADIFFNLRTRKTWSVKCSKLNGSTFTIFIDLCEYNWGLKTLFESNAEPYDCLLTHWLPMTSILYLKQAISCNIFRSIYLRNENNFLTFFLHFLNSNSILIIF